MSFKVAYNACFGGFSLSTRCVKRIAEIAPCGHPSKSIEAGEFSGYELMDKITRHDEYLIRAIEELGDSANGMCADLRVAEICGPMYRIDEYDGNESVEVPDSIDWVVIS